MDESHDLCPHCGHQLVRADVLHWSCEHCRTDFTSAALEYYAANPDQADPRRAGRAR